MLLGAPFSADWRKNIDLRIITQTVYVPRLSFQRGRFSCQPALQHRACMCVIQACVFQICDDESDEEEGGPPLIYEDMDSDEEDSEVDDAMEIEEKGTDEEDSEVDDAMETERKGTDKEESEVDEWRRSQHLNSGY